MRTESSRGWMLRLAGCAFLLSGYSPWQPAAAQDLEYAVKAAFLVRFGSYVTWPAASFRGRDDPLVICVIGNDPFGATLDRAAAEQLIGGHPVRVRRLKLAGPDTGCHIAYLGGADGQRPAQMADALGEAAVLTVSDAAIGAATASGIVHFVVRDDRVRFEIDDAAAAHDGLTISSKLLGLALTVKRRPS